MRPQPIGGAAVLMLGLMALGVAGLQGCATSRQRCGLAACGDEADALLKVTAEQLSTPARSLEIYDVRHYPGATTAWRARSGGQAYQCREARDPADPSRVHFVYCRPPT